MSLLLTMSGLTDAAAGAAPVPIEVKTYTSPAQGTTPATVTISPNNTEDIVVKLESWDATHPMGAPTGGSQTYTARVTFGPAGFRPWVGIYTATISGSPGAFTISSTPFGSDRYSMTVERWPAGTLAASPVTRQFDNAGAVSANDSLTTTAANSVVSWVASDAQSVDPTPGVTLVGTGTLELLRDNHSGANGVAYHGRTVGGTAGATSYGVTSPSGMQFAIAGIEMLAATGSGTTPFTKSVTESYTVYNAWTNSVTESYRVTNAFSSSVTESYRVLNAITVTQAESYRVFNALTVTQSETYSVLNAWTVSVVERYSLLTPFTSSVTESYRVLNAWTLGKTESYRVLNAFSSGIAESYRVLAAWTKSVTESYRITNAFSASVTESYRVLGAWALAGVTESYRVFNALSIVAPESYRVFNTWSVSVAEAYNVLSATSFTVSATEQYRVFGAFSSSITERFSVLNPWSVSKPETYRVFNAISIAVNERYRVLNTWSLSDPETYRVLGAWAVAAPEQYRVLNSWTKSAVEIYDILSAALIPFTLTVIEQYRVFNAITKIVIDRYRVGDPPVEPPANTIRVELTRGRTPTVSIVAPTITANRVRKTWTVDRG